MSRMLQLAGVVSMTALAAAILWLIGFTFDRMLAHVTPDGKAQRTTLRRLVAEYRARFPNIVVRGHRDWPGVKKACPSFDVGTEL